MIQARPSLFRPDATVMVIISYCSFSQNKINSIHKWVEIISGDAPALFRYIKYCMDHEGQINYKEMPAEHYISNPNLSAIFGP